MDKMSILIVDDEALTRKSLIAGVDWERLNIGDIYEAYSAEFAKRIILGNRIDIILLDVEMPGENGIEFLEWIRNEARLNVPCAFLTCHASFEYAQAAMKLHGFDYLLKPMNYWEVEDLILRMCGNSKEQVEKQRVEKYGKQWIQEKTDEGHKYEKEPSNTKEIINELIVYIRAHMSEKLVLTDLAYHAGLNPNYLNKVFKQETGTTVNKFIINERMQLAAELLKEGKLKSYAIAITVGYDNYANFVNMFKKTYGVSPNAYQEANTK